MKLDCPLCSSNVAHLRHHLRSAHNIFNPTERQILLRWARGREEKLRNLTCPLCFRKTAFIEMHLLKKHSHLTVSIVTKTVEELKWNVTIEQLTRLRQTNPKIPMASTLDVTESVTGDEQVPDPQLQIDKDFIELLGEIIDLPDDLRVFYGAGDRSCPGLKC